MGSEGKGRPATYLTLILFASASRQVLDDGFSRMNASGIYGHLVQSTNDYSLALLVLRQAPALLATRSPSLVVRRECLVALSVLLYADVGIMMRRSEA